MYEIYNIIIIIYALRLTTDEIKPKKHVALHQSRDTSCDTSRDTSCDMSCDSLCRAAHLQHVVGHRAARLLHHVGDAATV